MQSELATGTDDGDPDLLEGVGERSKRRAEPAESAPELVQMGRLGEGKGGKGQGPTCLAGQESAYYVTQPG